jgi:Uma2 family endonuclease
VAESRLLGILTGPFVDAVDGPGGWVAVQEPEIHFATDGLEVVVPDVAAWHRDRLPQRPAKAFVEIAPDWVCEVLSPGTAKRDRTIKKDVYRREKVGHLWLIDPKDHVLEAYALVGDAWEALGRWPIPTEPGSMFRIPPFDAVPLDLAKLWKW